mmetsp:Transcript_8814/g.10544  ORF Transcript_8814/g.10544 Transcript_8814/m.10544 type:complete len:569 (-) Transcript_8814:44-1750(-)
MSNNFFRVLNSPDTARCLQGAVVVAQQLLRTQEISKVVQQNSKTLQELARITAEQLYDAQASNRTNIPDSTSTVDNGFKAEVNEEERAQMLKLQKQYEGKNEVVGSAEWREKQVPGSPVARVAGFGALAVGLVGGGVAEAISRIGDASGKVSESVFASEGNSELLARSLCRMRGAALKVGQMMSIQDESLMPPHLAKALDKVRQNADIMPEKQLHGMLKNGLGEDWETKFVKFDPVPFAAASLGQVHRAFVKDNESFDQEEIEVAVKVQYPGVAESIDSDLANLKMLASVTGVFPKGIFIENIIKVMKEELKEECNYVLEAEHQERFRDMILFPSGNNQFYPSNDDNFYVPKVVSNLSTERILTTEWAHGVPIDHVKHFPQSVRNSVGRRLLKLSLLELFHFRYMQTDPNYSNFLYDVDKDRITLIDFGATRSYSKEFVSKYLELVWAASNMNREKVLEISKEIGFLTGEESQLMVNAHIDAGLEVGRPFQRNAPFDFKASKLSTKMSQHGTTFATERLTPPPREIYSLHRKLSGAYMTCIKIGAVFTCRDLLINTIEEINPDLLENL